MQSQQGFKHVACVVMQNNDEQTEYSVILSQLIKTAERNKNKSKHANYYSDTIKYFSTYIFLLCGRTCYETLCRNLPIPSTKTICECIYLIEIFFWILLVYNKLSNIIEFNQIDFYIQVVQNFIQIEIPEKFAVVVDISLTLFSLYFSLSAVY